MASKQQATATATAAGTHPTTAASTHPTTAASSQPTSAPAASPRDTGIVGHPLLLADKSPLYVVLVLCGLGVLLALTLVVVARGRGGKPPGSS